MNSNNAYSMLTNENLTCTICCYILDEPITLSCGHSFCRKCAFNWYITYKRTTCPICRQKIDNKIPKVNVILKAICDSLKDQERINFNLKNEQNMMNARVIPNGKTTRNKASRRHKETERNISIMDKKYFTEQNVNADHDFIQSTTCKFSNLIYFSFLEIIRGSINFLITLIIFIVS
jgi:hypothetical protein